MQLSPIIVIHMTAALGALVTGPVALWARKGATQRPQLHRAFGYAWVTLMIVTAVSAAFIRSELKFSFAGFSPIHLFIPATFIGLFFAFRALANRNIAQHKAIMQRLYFGAGIGAGVFTLAPNRTIGKFLGTGYLAPIVTNTPLWVWGLLVGLLVLGYTQTRDRNASLTRMLVTPAVMTAFSLWGTVNTFGNAATFSLVMMTWAVVAAGVFSLVAAGTAKASYDAATRSFALPGSWVPMGLILGIFMIKYASGVAIAMNHSLVNDLTFGVTLAALSGVFSGLFTGRAVRVLKLAVRPSPAIALQA
ncbi:DUF6622 family protein [Ramlibacter albus]|uniref:DUF2306 domain-containing protein n=1 Tax=Ramlibacter albus TaxID=2079448 RepID=A0A923MAB6_9BURK|nr:DUF6622 family protein [Ramlibacter albus]MBC5767217.1 DUF2306 domain-containing protein [Ramlibacter albus]